MDKAKDSADNEEVTSSMKIVVAVLISTLL